MKTLGKFLTISMAITCLWACGDEPVEKAHADETPAETKADQPHVKLYPQQSAAQNAGPETSAPVPAARTPRKTAQSVPPRRARLRTPFPVRQCINLGNALEAPREGEWGYTIRARDIATIKQAGFDTIRLPVRWDTHAGHRAPYTIDAGFMSRVRQVIDQAQAQGLNVIVDVHHYENLMTNTARETPRFLAIWDQIAAALQSEPNSVIFEALNEPTLDISMQEVNALYAKLLPVIRRTNPSRPVIIGGNSWNSVESLAAVEWPDDANIVATYHDYGPHEFTHQGAEWMEPKMPLGRRWGGQSDRVEMRDTFAKAARFKARNQLPVLVGEFGVINKVNDQSRAQWIKARRIAMESQGLSWCVWDFSGAFSLYDLPNERWKPGMLDALFGRG